MVYTDVLLNESHIKKSGSYNMGANIGRSIVTAEVIDYDGFDGNYAIFWKQIEIEFGQKWIIEKVMKTFELGTPWYFNDGNGDHAFDKNMQYDGADEITTTSSRIVTYFLTYKINGVITKKELAHCTMGGQSYENHVSSYNFYKPFALQGTRVYGVSVQVNDKFIVYTYELGSANGAIEPGQAYDGSYSLENWNEDGKGNPIWSFDKRMVGLININDGVSDVGYLKEEEYNVFNIKNKLAPTVYAVGTVDK